MASIRVGCPIQPNRAGKYFRRELRMFVSKHPNGGGDGSFRVVIACHS
jgi:hypothetical protein